MRQAKEDLYNALIERDFGTIAELALKEKRIFTRLIGMAFDKDDLIAWRSIEAVGAATAAVSGQNSKRVRNLAQRILWSAREESGSMGWSAPELLAEIVSASPKQFADLPPIIVSLHSEDEEKVFLKGVLWAIERMGRAGIRDVHGAEEVVLMGLDDPDEEVRGLAARAAAAIESRSAKKRLGELISDHGRFTVYEDGSLRQKDIAEIARAAAGRP